MNNQFNNMIGNISIIQNISYAVFVGVYMQPRKLNGLCQDEY